MLTGGHLRFPCTLGRGGLEALKREGDGATPAGRFGVREAFYRGDRIRRPRTGIPSKRLSPDDGWCDAVGDRNYNRWVRHPYPGRAERMWREDGLYDVVVVLGYNDRPRVQGRGSAIFMHVASAAQRPTEGCIALRRADLLRLLGVLGRGAVIRIGA
jgi:L,D-peptidoglycan transpeptidase YkuD (ErfK/YbiS/YcfS/YnhG family)